MDDGVESVVRAIPVAATGWHEVEEMPNRREQVDAALAVGEHWVRRIDVPHGVTLFREDGDRRIGITIGIFGVNGTSEGGPIVGQ